MSQSMRTAVAAAADAHLRARLPSLLASVNIALKEMVFDGPAALEAVVQHRPDLLLADVHLPLLDGNALAMHALSDGMLPVRPRILLFRRQEFLLPDRAKLEEVGALYLSWPCTEMQLREAVNALTAQKTCFPGKQRRRIGELLDALGFEPHRGREALRLSALLCAQDIRLLHGRSRKLYPVVGEMLGIDANAVERAMRSAISAAWRSNQFENQYRIFADTVDAGRGQPSCGEMIACLADILRLEG